MAPEPCPICASPKTHSEEFVVPMTDSPLNIIICEHCGHAARLPRPSLVSNVRAQAQLADRAAQAPNSPHRWPRRFALIAQEVRRLLGECGSVMDIGCGCGLWLASLGSDWQKFGLEISPRAAAVARAFSGADVFCAPIEEFEFDPVSFDLVTAFAVIEHLTEPHILVDWAYRHLNPGGLLLLMTGDRESSYAKEMGHSWRLYAPKEHVHFFSARSLCRLLGDGAFDIQRREWRYMPYGQITPFWFRLTGRCRDVLGLVTKPIYDHFYVYARKPLIGGETEGRAGSSADLQHAVDAAGRRPSAD